MEFAAWMAEQPQQVKDEAQGRVDAALGRAEFYARGGVLDGFCLCSDCCFNDNPFFSPTMFEEFVWPYLSRLIAGYRELGFYVIKHTDGNIMPILEALVAAGPHAVHSLDPPGRGGPGGGQAPGGPEGLPDRQCLLRRAGHGQR